MWFLRIESVAKTKCLLVTKANLPDARAWIDANLEWLIRKSIPQGISPPAHILPRRLDKPVYSATSQTYADILKKQFSLASTTHNPETDITRPPRKRQAKILDYDSDQSTGSPTVTSNSNSSSCTLLSTGTQNAAKADYTAELASLKNELQSLRTLITTAVAQLKTEIASLHATPTPSDMTIDEDHSQKTTTNSPTTNELSDLIAELRHDIATIVLESRAMFQQQAILKVPINQKHTSVT